jgi:WD40 repeat protein
MARSGFRIVVILLACPIVAWSFVAEAADSATYQGLNLTQIEALQVLPGWCQVLEFTPDQHLLAANWLETTVWARSDWSVVTRLDRSSLGLRVLGVTPDGTRFLAAHDSGDVELLDATTRAVIAQFGRLDGSDRPRSAFSEDGRLMALKNREKEVDVWDLESGTRRYTLRGHGSEVLSVAFSADGRWLATGAGRLEGTISDSLIKVWDAESGAPITTLATLAIGSNLSLVFAPDGSKLITAGTYGVIVYDTATWTQVERLSGHRTWSHDGAISPDGRFLATVNDFSELCLWSAVTWELQMVRPLPATATHVAFSEDGLLLACALVDPGEILVFSLDL